MIRKSVFAFAAIAALGTSALMPTAANATWYGYGKPYYGWHYGHYPHGHLYHQGFYGPRYFYGKPWGWHYGWSHY